MPTDHERIEAIKLRIAAMKAKLESLPAMLRLTAAIQENEARVEKLELKEAKRAADQKRRDDTKAKILIGAGVSKFAINPFTTTMREVVAVLTEPDREWLESWMKNRGIGLGDPADLAHNLSAPDATHPADLIGDVFKRIFSNLGEGTYELLSAEMLGRVGEGDKALLEHWFSTIANR